MSKSLTDTEQTRTVQVNYIRHTVSTLQNTS